MGGCFLMSLGLAAAERYLTLSHRQPTASQSIRQGSRDRVRPVATSDDDVERVGRLTKDRSQEGRQIANQRCHAITPIARDDGVRMFVRTYQATIQGMPENVHQAGMANRETFDFAPRGTLRDKRVLVYDVVNRVPA